MPVCLLSADPVDGVPTFLLHVTDVLDWATGNEFATIGVRLLRQACGPIHLRVNLGAVDDVDIPGLHSIETVAEAVASWRGTVVLEQMSLAVFRLLELTGTGGEWLDGCGTPASLPPV